MPRKKALPTTEADLNALLQVWKVKLPIHKGPLGLDTDLVDQLVKDASNLEALLDYTPQLRTAVGAYYEFKDSVIEGPKGAIITPTAIPAVALPNDAVPGIVPRMEQMRQMIYASSGITEMIGLDLDVFTSEEAPLDFDLVTAALTLGARPGSDVRIQWPKGEFDAMRIEFMLQGGSEWLHVGDPTSSPYLHSLAHPEPQIRKYRGRYLKKNEPVGNYSPEYTVVTTP